MFSMALYITGLLLFALYGFIWWKIGVDAIKTDDYLFLILIFVMAITTKIIGQDA